MVRKRRIHRFVLGGAAGCLFLGLGPLANAKQADLQGAHTQADYAGVAAFNRAFTAATRALDDEAILSLWEDDGIALLPDTAPVQGKSRIRSMLQSITSAHPKARMESFTNKCFDIEGRGPWASEWCLEHQIVSEVGQPTFDSWGKMLLILHRQPSGEWKLSREMWNHADASEKPSSRKADEPHH